MSCAAVHTDQSSSGIAFAAGVPFQNELGAKYWDVLPSLNLALRFPSDFVIRLGLSRQIQRPRLDDLRVALSYGVDTNSANCLDGATSCYSGGGGNPRLRPYRANAVDLTFEKYFGTSGYLSAQLYYKDIVNYVSDGRIEFDFSGLPAPTGVLPGTSTTGFLSTKANTEGGYMYGGELAGTLPFAVFSSALQGFGIPAASLHQDQRQGFHGNRSPDPRLLEWVANGTVFFEQAGSALVAAFAIGRASGRLHRLRWQPGPAGRAQGNHLRRATGLGSTGVVLQACRSTCRDRI